MKREQEIERASLGLVLLGGRKDEEKDGGGKRKICSSLKGRNRS